MQPVAIEDLMQGVTGDRGREREEGFWSEWGEGEKKEVRTRTEIFTKSTDRQLKIRRGFDRHYLPRS